MQRKKKKKERKKHSKITSQQYRRGKGCEKTAKESGKRVKRKKTKAMGRASRQAGRQAGRVHVGPGQRSSERRVDGDGWTVMGGGGGGSEWEEGYPTKLGRERMSERGKVRTRSCLRV